MATANTNLSVYDADEVPSGKDYNVVVVVADAAATLIIPSTPNKIFPPAKPDPEEYTSINFAILFVFLFVLMFVFLARFVQS